MRSKFIFLTILSFVSIKSLAQEKRELDWQKFSKSIQATEITKPVRSGEFTIFQISDINKFLYKVEIEGRSFELQTPIPSELQTLFRLTPVELQKSVNNKKAEEAVESIAKAIPPMDAIKKSEEIKKETEDAKDTADTSAIVSAKANLIATLDELVAKCEKYLTLSKQVSNDILELKSSRNELVSIAQMDLSFSEISSKVAGVKRPSPSIKSNYIEFKDLYNQVERLYEEADVNATLAKVTNKEKATISSSSEKVERASDLIEEEALLGLLADVDFLSSELDNKNNFIAVAPPVQMDGDIISYDVSITPSATRNLAAYRSPMQFKFDIPARDGLKVDFSVGPVLSLGGNAKDEKYYLDAGSNSNTVILKQRNNNNVISPGIAAMMHIYPRTGKYSALGGMFGVGAGFQDISDVNLSMFTGLTWVLGKRQKVMLSTGLSFLRVDRIKNDEFVSGNEYAISKINISDVTEKVFKTSWFFSISYNLTNRVEVK